MLLIENRSIRSGSRLDEMPDKAVAEIHLRVSQATFPLRTLTTRYKKIQNGE
jgi:hypothetical protein